MSYTPLYEYRACLERVVDGDTVVMTIDHGMRIRSQQSIRLAGVDTPERGEERWGEATDRVISWFMEHDDASDWPFVVETFKDRQSFNRYVGTIMCAQCDEFLSEHMEEWASEG